MYYSERYILYIKISVLYKNPRGWIFNETFLCLFFPIYFKRLK